MIAPYGHADYANENVAPRHRRVAERRAEARKGCIYIEFDDLRLYIRIRLCGYGV